MSFLQSLIESFTSLNAPARSSRPYPCLDKYPEGKEFLTDRQILNDATKKVVSSLKDAKLGSSMTPRVQPLIRQEFEKLRAAFKVSSLWDKGTTIRIHFLDGTDKQKNWVQQVVMDKLAPLVSSLSFQWNVPMDQSDFRISFATPNQAWSYVGTDCLQIPKPDPTMNLGWIDDDVQFDAPPFKNTGQVVVHEFCHALGMVHEHQNPKNNGIVWNKPVVYEELARSNNWSKQQVDHNLFQKYGDAEMCSKVKSMAPYPDQSADILGYCEGDVVNGSEYDIHSIMHYWYPPKWILSGPTEIPINTELSALDKQWLSNYYAISGTNPTPDAPGKETPTTTTDSTDKGPESPPSPSNPTGFITSNLEVDATAITIAILVVYIGFIATQLI